VHLLKETISILSKKGVNFSIWTSSSSEFTPPRNEYYSSFQIYSPSRLKDVFDLRSIIQSVKYLINFWSTRNQVVTCFIMPSPFDLPLYLINKVGGLTISCIHDVSPHLGERWPSKRAIYFRLKLTDQIVCFSKSVASSIKAFKGEIVVARLPTTITSLGKVSEDTISSLKPVSSKPILLMIGRILPYKNLELFNQLAQILSNEFLFYVAGEFGYESELSPKIVKVDTWLSEADLIYVIQNCSIGYFLYKEASQSGLIPIFMKENKFIIVSNQSGLVEQVEGYKGATLVNLNDSLDDIANAVRSQFNEFLKLTNSPEHPLSDSSEYMTNKEPLGEILTQIN